MYLHLSARLGHVLLIRHLLQNGAAVNATNIFGQTALSMCTYTYQPSVAVALELMGAGADPAIQDLFGNSVVMTISNHTWMMATPGRFNFTRVVTESSPSLDEFYDLLVLSGRRCLESLLETGVDVNKQYEDNWTVVHMLAQNVNPGVVQLLEGHVFDVECRNDMEETPLMCAASVSNVPGIRFFLDHGAQVNATDRSGENALYKIVAAPNDDQVLLDGVTVLLEWGANVQVIVDLPGDIKHTLIELIFELDRQRVATMLICHLCLDVAKGEPLLKLVEDKIGIISGYAQLYGQLCQKSLAVEIFPSMSLAKVLSLQRRQLENLTRNGETFKALSEFNSDVEHYNCILKKRLLRAKQTADLKDAAFDTVMNILSAHSAANDPVARIILDYLDGADQHSVISSKIE